MTEEEWLACDEPQTLLEFANLKTTPRKARLLAASFCRHILPLAGEICCEKAIGIAEQYADGLVSLQDMLSVRDEVMDVYSNPLDFAPYLVNTELPLSIKMKSIAIQSAAFLTWNNERFLIDVCICTEKASRREALLQNTDPPYTTLMRWQLLLIRDVIGNSFRPIPIDPRWQTSTVVDLATVIYDERAFDRMPILADALMDAGCDNQEIIAHCRSERRHARGCWVVDLLLNRK